MGRLLDYYKVTKAGISAGSLGKKHFLILLQSSSEELKDPLLIDLKQTYTESNTPHFFTPIQHQGLRMIRAANLYAPNVEQRLGYFTIDKEHFWGREIPSFNAKIKFLLSTQQQEELAYIVGAQLGRGHRLSLYHTEPRSILTHLKANMHAFQEYSEWMLQVIKKQVETIQTQQESLTSK